ncbi:DUF3617 domain-containing protein [Parasphingopyxis marina]|uniref:DUF3617 domain-containing protein n=1 Tax=Parasphingopyxis marina TaxID=2761622 RepID=A0A842HY90_9SPHN|nr:DUF3617 domain-containing protein [Parasphingopyxis marina]MBC2776464.1 DUF3617 domain-containing protein [Parasphingopyxis marina]
MRLIPNTLPLAALAPFALAGCGDSEPEMPYETELVENRVQTGELAEQPLRPGLWSLSETIGEVDQATMSGAQEAEIEADGDRRGNARTICLPVEYADRPPAEFWAGSGNACQYDEFRMADDALTARLTCNATPGSITLALDGSYSETGFDLAITTMRTGTGSENITVNGRLEGEWRRECTAEEAG